MKVLESYTLAGGYYHCYSPTILDLEITSDVPTLLKLISSVQYIRALLRIAAGGLIGSRIPGAQEKLVNQAEIFEAPWPHRIRKCFGHKREPQTPLSPVVEGSKVAATGHFVVPRRPSVVVAFYDSFLFIVEPESLVHNGPVRAVCGLGVAAPSSSLQQPRFFHLWTRREERRGETEKSTGAPSL